MRERTSGHDDDPPALKRLAALLRDGTVSARELAERAIERYASHGSELNAYRTFQPERVRAAAEAADRQLRDGTGGPLCGIPISVKDLYGVAGYDTHAGTTRALPKRWEAEGWLVRRLRDQGAVFTGKTHTVELAFGAVGLNPHHESPRNPWDPDRVAGGSSSGAGVSLVEGSALVALGTDTGGSIRVPAAWTGTVGHKTTAGRWPTSGVVPLSSTFDTVGALTRSVEDAAYVFAAVDPEASVDALLPELESASRRRFRLGRPECAVWDACTPGVARVLADALDVLERGLPVRRIDGHLVDDAVDLYLRGGIAGAECRAFLARELPERVEHLHPIVGARLADAPPLDSRRYREALARRETLARSPIFDDCDVLVLPGAVRAPPTFRELEAEGAYTDANVQALTPTCGINVLGHCALALPAGLDETGLPVSLQLVAPHGEDLLLLAASLAVERLIGGR